MVFPANGEWACDTSESLPLPSLGRLPVLWILLQDVRFAPRALDRCITVPARPSRCVFTCGAVRSIAVETVARQRNAAIASARSSCTNFCVETADIRRSLILAGP